MSRVKRPRGAGARIPRTWRRAAAGAVATTVALTAVGIGAAAAAAPAPCTAIDGGKYNCTFYVAGDGKSGGAPVQVGGTTVGYLHKGTNWVLCQQVGGRVTSGKFFNNNWAWTLADNLKYGWVNAVYASGGGNDGPFGGVPGCNNAHGAPPGGPGGPGAPPAPPPPPGPPAAGFPPDVTSAPDKARYDDAASWSGGKNCSGGFTVGAKRLQAWIRANWGAATIQGYNCRPNTADRSKTSIHGVGRASDWFRKAGNAAQAAQVASFIQRMSANSAAMARAMGVQYWIWNRQQYSVKSTGVVRSRYTGPNPHTDHVHIEQNLAGSKLQTSYWRLAGR
jgi:hypothetical protein